MSLKYIVAFISFFMFVQLVIGQEDEYPTDPVSPDQEITDDELKKNQENGYELIAIPEGSKKKKDKKEKASKKVNPKKEGPLLIATNSKQKLVREFEIGEKVAYKSKTNKKVMKGELEEIDKEYVKVDGKRVKITSLVMVKKKFVKTMGWRAVGLTRFAIGTGIAAVGAGIAIFSFQQIDPNSTRVIWGALGAVFGTGVGLVGTHLMLKGSKGMFQSSKLKKEKDWKFSAKL
jgi:hypothetical protein